MYDQVPALKSGRKVWKFDGNCSSVTPTRRQGRP